MIPIGTLSSSIAFKLPIPGTEIAFWPGSYLTLYRRITIAYFCVSGLQLLGCLEEKISPEQRNGSIDWIWSLQARTFAQ